MDFQNFKVQPLPKNKEITKFEIKFYKYFYFFIFLTKFYKIKFFLKKYIFFIFSIFTIKSSFIYYNLVTTFKHEITS